MEEVVGVGLGRVGGLQGARVSDAPVTAVRSCEAERDRACFLCAPCGILRVALENPYFLSKSLRRNPLELFRLARFASTLRLTGKKLQGRSFLLFVHFWHLVVMESSMFRARIQTSKIS